MVNVDLNGPITCFHDTAADPETETAGQSDSPGYLRQRERSERAAAKRAPSLVARRIHQQLAEAYAKKLTGGDRR